MRAVLATDKTRRSTSPTASLRLRTLLAVLLAALVLCLPQTAFAQEDEEDDANYFQAALISAPGIVIGLGGAGVAGFSAVALGRRRSSPAWVSPTYSAAGITALVAGVYTYLGAAVADTTGVSNLFYGVAIGNGVVALANLGIGIGHSVKVSSTTANSGLDLRDIRLGTGTVIDVGQNPIQTITMSGRF